MKNRKVPIALILLIGATVCISFSGCKERTYRLLLPSSKEELSTFHRALEAPGTETEASVFMDTKAPRERTVRYHGNDVHGTYNFSYKNYRNDTVIDRYRVDRGAKGSPVQFYVRKTDGKLLYIEFDTASETVALPLISEDEALEKARIEASEWISINESRETRVMLSEEGKPESGYVYRFFRTHEGIDTTDFVEVAITEQGTLWYLSGPDPGWTERKGSELRAFSMEKAEQAVKEGFPHPIYRIVPARFGLNEKDRVYLEYSVFTSNDTAMTVFVILE